MLKKRIFHLLAFLVCFFVIGTSADAAKRTPETISFGDMTVSCSVYNDQVSIGGIKCGYDMQAITDALGNPSPFYTKNGDIWHYDGLSIKFVDYDGNGHPVACDITATGEKYATPDGVKVGMPESVLTEIYGEADVVHTEKFTAPKLSHEQNKFYRERSSTVYTYHAAPLLALSFVVREGIISEINVHQAD